MARRHAVVLFPFFVFFLTFSLSLSAKLSLEEACDRGSSSGGSFALRVMSYNVWNYDSGRDWDVRKKVVAEIVKRADVDVVAFQELRWHPTKGNMVHDLVEAIGKDHPLTTTVIERAAMLYGDKTVEGVAIFSRFPIVGRASKLFRINAFEPLGDPFDNNQRIGLLTRLNVTAALQSRHRCAASAPSSSASSPTAASALKKAGLSANADGRDSHGYTIDIVSTHFSYSRSHQHGNSIDLSFLLEEARTGELFVNANAKGRGRGRGQSARKRIPAPIEKKLRGKLLGQFVGGDFNTYPNFASPLLLLTQHGRTMLPLFPESEDALSDSFADVHSLSLLDHPKEETMTFSVEEPKARCDGLLYRHIHEHSTVLNEGKEGEAVEEKEEKQEKHPNALLVPLSSQLLGTEEESLQVASELGLGEAVLASDHKAVVSTFAVYLPPFPSLNDLKETSTEEKDENVSIIDAFGVHHSHDEL